MRIKNWKLAILALILFCIFVRLGFWQLARADFKYKNGDIQTERLKKPYLNSKNLHAHDDLRFYRIELHGFFDNEHSFLLDNKIYNGKVGYEVFTPFKVAGFAQAILIDRGFIASRDRNHLPEISPISGQLTIKGMVNKSPSIVTFGKMLDTNEIKWPLRVEYIDLKELNKLLNMDFFPWIISLQQGDAAAFEIDWKNNSMPAEKHLAYAFQWFALALTLLILFVALNRKEKKQ